MNQSLEPTARQLRRLLQETLVRQRRLYRLCRQQGHKLAELQTAYDKLEHERNQWREKALMLEIQMKVSNLASRLEEKSQREEIRAWLDRLIARIDEALKHLD